MPNIKQIKEFNTTPGITEDGKFLVWDNTSGQFVYSNSSYDDTIIQGQVDINTAKISFDSTSSSRLSNTSGTNTGDQIISDNTITLSDITTNNASTTKHGFLPKLSNVSNQFMNGTGNWVTPALITEIDGGSA